jgi:hypothetical protein
MDKEIFRNINQKSVELPNDQALYTMLAFYLFYFIILVHNENHYNAIVRLLYCHRLETQNT